MTSSPVLAQRGPEPGQPGADGPVLVAADKARRARRPRALITAASSPAVPFSLPRSNTHWIVPPSKPVIA